MSRALLNSNLSTHRQAPTFLQMPPPQDGASTNPIYSLRIVRDFKYVRPTPYLRYFSRCLANSLVEYSSRSIIANGL
jgi:hypothetical protein